MNGRRGAPKKSYSAPHPGRCGNPPKYTREELIAKIDGYWQWCEDHKHTVTIGKTTKELTTPPTLTRLCLHLDISRETWATWGHDARYADIVIRARQRIEAQLQEMAVMGLYDAKIATLTLTNHYGWAVKSEVQTTTNPLTDAELESRIKSILQADPQVRLVGNEAGSTPDNAILSQVDAPESQVDTIIPINSAK